MSCDVAVLNFQAHANYGTWSIDFDSNKIQALNNKGKSSGLINITKE